MNPGEYQEWLNKLGWRENPFTLQIRPEFFVGYKEQVEEISLAIEERAKISLVLGPTGSGKTTLLSYLSSKRDNLIFISKPPKTTKDILELHPVIKRKLSFLDRLFFFPPDNIYTYIEKLSKKVKKPLFLVVDEAHESEIDVLEWFRVLCDQVDNLNLILSALPIFEEKLKKLETLKKRILHTITLGTLSKEETIELIRKRVSWASGKDDLYPFTNEILDYIYDKTKGFPRDVIVLCNKLIDDAVKRGSLELRPLEELGEEGKDDILKIVSRLPKKQKTVLDIIANNEPISTSEIIEHLDLSKYPSKNHAIRAVNNILKKLCDNNLVERYQVGKTFKYKLTTPTKTIYIKG